MNQSPVFLAELDDDYQDLARLSQVEMQRRLRCYLLLAPSLIVHPAYFWQSNQTHDLVFNSTNRIFTPEVVKLSLGDSPTVADYMRQRMNSVQARGVPITQESVRYQSWGGELQREAASLDGLFATHDPMRLSISRDAKFRSLISRDLSHVPAAGITLRELLIAHMQFLSREDRVRAIVGNLRRFVADSSLVSVDSVTEYLAKRGLGGLGQDSMFRRRLLALYYRANVDGDQVVAGIHAVDPDDPVIHPFEHVLFWQVFSLIFGKELERFLADDVSADSGEVIMKLRSESAWRAFAADYAATRMAADTLLKLEAASIADQLAIRRDYVRLKVLPRVWREAKVEISASVGGLVVSGVDLVSFSWTTVLGAVGAIVGGLLTWNKVGGFRDEFEENQLTELRKLLRRRMRLVTRRRHELPILGAKG